MDKQRKPKSKLDSIKLNTTDLSDLMIRLETGYKEDWMPIFVPNKDDNYYAQFGTSEDLINSETEIKISALLALRIHDQVEKIGREKLLRDEELSEQIFEMEYKG